MGLEMRSVSGGATDCSCGGSLALGGSIMAAGLWSIGQDAIQQNNLKFTDVACCAST
jgi:hypothetical protein